MRRDPRQIIEHVATVVLVFLGIAAAIVVAPLTGPWLMQLSQPPAPKPVIPLEDPCYQPRHPVPPTLSIEGLT